ncbi:MAG: sulfide/dihydroorotate dehydrogenase-like FAD/NAD-binding protein [Bacillota bacterium]
MEILEKKPLAPQIMKFVVKAPLVAFKARPGHFVIVRANEKAERIPLTISDFDRAGGTITLVCQEVGRSTGEINRMEAGEAFLDIMGPLGMAYPVEKIGTVLCVAGGLGVAPLYPKAKALHEKGNTILTVMGARTREMLVMAGEMEGISREVFYSTDDGSFGHRGFVTDLVREVLLNNQVDEVIAIGPVPMMNAVCQLTRPMGKRTLVSLNAVMVDGSGMCGGCRVSVNGKTRFCCVDGPAFDGHAVDFKELMNRQRYYVDQEKQAYQIWREGCACGK